MPYTGKWGWCTAVVLTAAVSAGCAEFTVEKAQLLDADPTLLANGVTYQFEDFRLTLPPGWREDLRSGTKGTTYTSGVARVNVAVLEWRADQLFTYWVKEYSAEIRQDAVWHIRYESKFKLGERHARLYRGKREASGGQIAVIELGKGRAVELRYTTYRAMLSDEHVRTFHTIVQSIEFEPLPDAAGTF